MRQPHRRTGAHAILTTLHRNGGGPMSREKIIEEAERYTDTSMAKRNKALQKNQYDGWSAAKGLREKAMVVKVKDQWKLTEAGAKLAREHDADEKMHEQEEQSVHVGGAGVGVAISSEPMVKRQRVDAEPVDAAWTCGTCTLQGNIGPSCAVCGTMRVGAEAIAVASFGWTCRFCSAIVTQGESCPICYNARDPLVVVADTIALAPRPVSMSRVILVCDSAEAAVVNYLQAHNYEQRGLRVADYVWIVRKDTGEETMCNIIIERKSFSDLESSIIDGRYLEQKMRMQKLCKGTATMRCLYLLEDDGTGVRTTAAIPERRAELIAEGFTVVETRDAKETGRFLAATTDLIARNVERFATEMTFDEYQRRGRKWADPDVSELLEQMLMRIPGRHSKHKAAAIARRFGTVISLFEALQQADDPTALLAAMPAGPEHVGPVFAASVVEAIMH